MSKMKRHKAHAIMIRAAVAALTGGAFMILTILFTAWVTLKGTVGERGMGAWLLGAVFFGSLLTSALNRFTVLGAVPRILLSAGSFMLLLVILSVPGSDNLTSPLLSWKIAVAALAGSMAGMVTNLVKSNKSYINKSKRKRRIT